MNTINTSYNTIIPREYATGEAVTQPDPGQTAERQDNTSKEQTVYSASEKGAVVDQYA